MASKKNAKEQAPGDKAKSAGLSAPNKAKAGKGSTAPALDADADVDDTDVEFDVPPDEGDITSAVSRQTLEATPERVLSFLRAVGTNVLIRATLMSRGYTTKDHEEGWSLLRAVGQLADSGGALEEDPRARDAIAALDAWDEDGFRLITAALQRRHPEQATFVLSGLGPSKGPGAVLGVQRLLERLEALESGKERSATRAADKAALATLATRGIDQAERTRLSALVRQAQQAFEVTPLDETALAAQERHQLKALTDLRAWYVEWSTTARALFKRRDHLLLLGLARRKKPAAAEPVAAAASAE